MSDSASLTLVIMFLVSDFPRLLIVLRNGSTPVHCNIAALPPDIHASRAPTFWQVALLSKVRLLSSLHSHHDLNALRLEETFAFHTSCRHAGVCSCDPFFLGLEDCPIRGRIERSSFLLWSPTPMNKVRWSSWFCPN